MKRSAYKRRPCGNVGILIAKEFLFSSKKSPRYIARLFAKELVCKNSQDIALDELVEYMIEITLYMEKDIQITSNRLLKNTHLLRCAHPSSLRRTVKYASFLMTSRALHLNVLTSL